MRAADQQAAVLAARRQGLQPHEIAADASIWGDDAPVSITKVNSVWRSALRKITQPEADLARAKLRDELDALRAITWGVLRRKHVVVSGGSVVREGAWVRVPDEPAAMGRGVDFRQTEDGGWEVWDEHAGDALMDSGPVLAAVVELRKLAEAEARLFGLNLPVKVEVGGDVNVTYRIQGVDVNDVR